MHFNYSHVKRIQFTPAANTCTHVKMIDRMSEQQPCHKQLSTVTDACDETGHMSFCVSLSLYFYPSIIQALCVYELFPTADAISMHRLYTFSVAHHNKYFVLMIKNTSNSLHDRSI